MRRFAAPRRCSSNVAAARDLRVGFTLLELIIVIGLLAVLAGILFSAIGGAMASARETQTQTIIRMIDGVLQQRITKYNSDVLNQPSFGFYDVSERGGEFGARFTAANGSVLGAASSEYFAKKQLFASIFPQRFEDLCGFDGRPGVPGADDDGGGDSDATSGNVDLFELGLGGNATDDPPTATAIRQAVTELGNVNLANHQPATESAELLYLCMTNEILRDFPVLAADNIPASYVQDTDDDGLLEFVDGFGIPLRFYTYSTGLFRPTAWTWETATARTDITAEQAILAYSLASAQLGTDVPTAGVSGTAAADATHPLNKDLDDRFNSVRGAGVADMPAPEDNLSAAAGFSLEYPVAGTNVTDAPALPITFGTASYPLIVSVGRDEILGLTEPTDDSSGRYAMPTDVATAVDNLTNLQGGPQ